MVGAPCKRHNGQVGALAWFKGTHPAVESQGPGGIERREPQGILREQCLRLPLTSAGGHDRGARLVEHVE